MGGRPGGGRRRGAGSCRARSHGRGWKWGLRLNLPDAPVPGGRAGGRSGDRRRALARAGRDSERGENGGSRRDRLLHACGKRSRRRAPICSERCLRALAQPRRKPGSVLSASLPGRRRSLVSADARLLLFEENTAYLDVIGVTGNERTPPAEVRSLDGLSRFRKTRPRRPRRLRPDPRRAPRRRGAARPGERPVRRRDSPFRGRRPKTRPSSGSGVSWRETSGPTHARPRSRPRTGAARDTFRVVSGTDLGGVVLVTGTRDGGPVESGRGLLALDPTPYASAEILGARDRGHEKTRHPRFGRSRPSFPVSREGPARGAPRRAAKRPPPSRRRRAVGVAAARGITAEEIFARHQAWRAARDARWKTLSATNTLSMRFRFANLGNTFELALAGPFFYEKGAGFDWAWRDAYFNGVRWRAKKLPELPLLQPEKGRGHAARAHAGRRVPLHARRRRPRERRRLLGARLRRRASP